MALLVYSRVVLTRCCDQLYFSSKYFVFPQNSSNLRLFCKHGNTRTRNLLKNANGIVQEFRIPNILEPRHTINRLSSSKSADDNQNSPKRHIQLTDRGPLFHFPNLLLTIKNFILTQYIIPMYFDKEFDSKEFLSGAKQALLFVSRHLASGTFSDLEGAVTPEALLDIEDNYKNLSDKQRHGLLVKDDDIIFCFVYQVGIIMEDDSKKRFTEITIVYHCSRGLKEKINQLDMQLIRDASAKDFMLCNYRFIKEFTEGVQSDWVINRLNHSFLKL